jgi:hypothetical protein
MLQLFATAISLLVGFAGIGVVALSLSGDWRLALAALGYDRRDIAFAPLPPQRPTAFARQIRVVRVSPQSAPQRAAA